MPAVVAAPSHASRKRWLRDLKHANQTLTLARIAAVCDVPRKQVEGWLYEENRAPPVFALALLLEYLWHAKMAIPREMQRAVMRERSRAKRFGVADRDGRERVTYLGDPNQRQFARYLFDGELVGARDVARMAQVGVHRVYQAISKHNIKPNDEITHEMLKRRGVLTFVLDGEQMTVADIAARFGFTASAVYQRLHRSGARHGDDVSSIFGVSHEE